VTFDPTITFGAIVNALVLLVGFAIAFTRIGGRIDLLSQRLTAVEEALKAFGNVSTRLAVNETVAATHAQMIAGLQKEIADMRRGSGFIAAGRERLDGE